MLKSVIATFSSNCDLAICSKVHHPVLVNFPQAAPNHGRGLSLGSDSLSNGHVLAVVLSADLIVKGVDDFSIQSNA